MNCRYDGGNAASGKVQSLIKKHTVIPVCPEQLGGLTTPRPRSEIVGGDGEDVLNGKARVKNSIGEDVTSRYIRGAEEVWKLAKLVGTKKVILKGKSPACGSGQICRDGRSTKGNGVCAALLIRHGIEIVPGNGS